VIASNHLITGAVIGLTFHNPAITLPLAFVSHFALDSLPHFGFDQSGFGFALKQKISYFVIVAELCFITLLAYTLRSSSVGVYAAMLVAFSPDLIWLSRYLFWERRNQTAPAYTNGPVARFHGRIQQFERPWGLIVDVAWFAGMFMILLELTR